MTKRMLAEARSKIADRPNIYLSAFFRSGSTHVKITLCRLLGYRPASAVISVGDFGNDSQQINHTAAQVLFPLPAQVFHSHTLGTCGTQTLLNLYKLNPVIMTRNILDSMVSLRELISTGERQHLGIFYPPWWRTMSEEEQFEWIASNVSNWYFVFYTTWNLTPNLNVHHIRYDDFYADQVKGIRGILDHIDIGKQGHVLDETIRKFTEPQVGGRLKFGISGRGRKLVPLSAIKIVKQQAMSWGKEWGPRMIEQLIER